MKPLVSITVPVLNHCEDLTIPFIRKLVDKTRNIPYELIIVNNGSDDGTEKKLAPYVKKYGIKLINLPKNLGFGAGHNIAYREAKGEYICFLTNDVLIDKSDWLEILLKECVKKEGLYGQSYYDSNTLTEVDHIPTPYIGGYILFGRKQMFEKIKDNDQIFDENFGKAYFEDVDLSVRVKDAGYPLIALNYLPVTHLGSKSSDQIQVNTTTIRAQRHFQNKMRKRALKGKKRIVFYFESAYGFLDSDYEGKGVGGSEQALILLAREYAKQGWVVEVYNKTLKDAEENGVKYRHIKDFRFWEYSDVFVLFRTPYKYLPYVNSVCKIFWSCDQYTTGNWRKDTFPYVDHVVAISDYHREYLKMVYGPVPHIITIDLGVTIADYPQMEKVRGKLIYCSVPLRGLQYLKDIYLGIKEKLPHVSLYITSDYRLWGTETAMNEEFIKDFTNTPDVHFLGKVTKRELVKHQNEAELMVYPCNYEECFCISAMECIAAGAVPITTRLGAMGTTVGESGILLSNTPTHKDYAKLFIEEAVSLLSNSKSLGSLREAGRMRARKYDWSLIVKKWITLIDSKEYLMPKSKKTKKEFAAREGDAKAVIVDKVVEIPIIMEEHKEPTGPRTQLLRFKKSILVQVNSHKFEGRDIDVPEEYVSAVLQIAREAYGPDIVDA